MSGASEGKNTLRYIYLTFLISVLAPIMIAVGISVGEYRLPEVTLPLLAISGVVALLGALATVSVALQTLGLADKTEALALPKGSVRALIALSLVIIYAITCTYLFRELQGDLVKQTTTLANGTKIETYQRVFVDKEVFNFASQILTTIGTLVVAVSSFYLGSRSVDVARRAVETPSIQVLNPPSPFDMIKEKDKKLSDIRIGVKPEGEAIKWEVKGDDKNTLVQVKFNEFVYTQSDAVKNTVSLIFTLVNYPDVSDELKINVNSLKITKPQSPYERNRADLKPIEIYIEASGEVEYSIKKGDDKGKLESVEDKKVYKYTPSQDANDEVTLEFKLKDFPDVSAELKITKT